jgi:hypothetical protein
MPQPADAIVAYTSLPCLAGLGEVLDLVEAHLYPAAYWWSWNGRGSGTAVDGPAATVLLGWPQSESWSRFIPLGQVHLARAAFGTLVGPVEPNASARIALRGATPVLTVFDQTPGVNYAWATPRVSLMASRCRHEGGIPALLLDASLLLFACPSALPAPASESHSLFPALARRWAARYLAVAIAIGYSLPAAGALACVRASDALGVEMITVTSAEWGHIEVAPAVAVVALDLPLPAVAVLPVAHVTTAGNSYGLLRARATQVGARRRPKKMMTPGGVRSAAMGPTFRRRQSAPHLRRTPSARQARLPASGAARPSARDAIPRQPCGIGGLSPGPRRASCSPHAGNCCGGGSPARLRGSLTTSTASSRSESKSTGTWRRSRSSAGCCAARRPGGPAWRHQNFSGVTAPGHTWAAAPAILRSTRSLSASRLRASAATSA